MNFFFPNKKEVNKITNEFNDQIKLTLKTQFCEYCKKIPSTKVAFVPDLKKGFTCNNCELEAVGKDFKNLSQKTLISNDKLSETITKGLINYQLAQSQSPNQVKEIQNELKNRIKTTHEAVEKVKTQLRMLKSNCEAKLNDLTKQSEQHNCVYLFEQLNKKIKEKKPSVSEISSLIAKKTYVSKSGLHFIDEQAIQNANNSLDARLDNLKAQTNIKLKEIDSLTDWINQIQL